MAYNAAKPANDDFLASFPPEMREQFRAIIEDQLVNALKLMGYSPGNATGNIPISNGTLNVNLNADKLDGNEATAFATSGHTHPLATQSTNGLESAADKLKLDNIAANAEVNQNSFSNVLVGATTIAAESETDTLELVAGSKITLTPDAVNDRVTIAFSGVIDSDVTAALNGVLTAGTVRSQLSLLDTTQRTAKTLPVDADVMGVNDSAASNALKKITWAEIKTALFGVPAGNGYILSSTTTGVRSWVVGVLSTVLTGLSTATATAVTAADTILIAIGKLQAQVTARLALAGGQMTGVLNEATGTAIASAATINLTTATGNLVHVTGTTTITAVTLGSGMRRTVVFDGVLTLTHHASNNNLPGGKNIVTAAGDRAIYTSDGTTVYCINYQRASGVAVDGGCGSMRALKVLVTSNTAISVTAEEIVLYNSLNHAISVFDANLTIGTGSVGANALDAGTVANSTWYSVWAIYNGSVVSGLLSTSATNPAMPSGYTHKKRIGWVKTHTDGSLLRTLQYGNSGKYVVTAATNTAVYPAIVSGVTTGTNVAASISGYIPSTARRGNFIAFAQQIYNGYLFLVSPNSSFATSFATVPFPPIGFWNNGPSGAHSFYEQFSFLLESTNIYYTVSSTSGCYVLIEGWEDNL